MARKRMVRVRLTPMQGRSLLQLAEEADLDTFESMGDPMALAEAKRRAGVRAMEILTDAIAEAGGWEED